MIYNNNGCENSLTFDNSHGILFLFMYKVHLFYTEAVQAVKQRKILVFLSYLSLFPPLSSCYKDKVEYM